MNNQKSNSNLSSNNKINNRSASASSNSVSSLNKIINSPVDTAKSNPVTALVLGLILVVLLYTAFSYAYSYYLSFRKAKVTTNTLLAAAHSGSAEYDIGSSDMATSSYSNEYALSFWIYVDDFNYRQGQRKFIMRRGSITTKANPEIYLHPNDNKLQVNVSLMTSNNEPTTTTTSSITSTTAPPAITTRTTAPPASVSPFTDMSASVDQQFIGNKSAGTCDCPESNSAPNSATGILNEIASNNPNIPASYYPDYFNMVSGNEVPEGEMPFMLSQNKTNGNIASILGLSKEDFADAPATGSCVCPPESSAMETDADRRDFEARAGKCIVDDFPLQKWVHVVVSQYNQVLDIYIDGKLRSSCVLPGFPDIVQDDLVISPDGGFGGMISKVEYTNSILSAKDVYNIYSMGPEAQAADILSMIPTWAWVVFVILVVGVLGYSLTK